MHSSVSVMRCRAVTYLISVATILFRSGKEHMQTEIVNQAIRYKTCCLSTRAQSHYGFNSKQHRLSRLFIPFYLDLLFGQYISSTLTPIYPSPALWHRPTTSPGLSRGLRRSRPVLTWSSSLRQNSRTSKSCLI